MKFHDTLNEKLFNIDTMEMLPEVREKLLEIADSFIEFLEIPEDAVLDKVVTGSSASYNYNKYSDLDLHIIVDYEKVHEDCPLVNGYLNALKKQFNDNHDIFIHGVPVELYAEQKDQGTVHNGLYSLQTGWIDKPQKIAPTDNDAAVEAKFNEIKELVDKCEDSEEAQELIDKIYNMRKAGLAEAGEFCTENLAFKKLRIEGCMEKLRKIKKEQIDKQLSLESYNEGLFLNEAKYEKIILSRRYPYDETCLLKADNSSKISVYNSWIDTTRYLKSQSSPYEAIDNLVKSLKNNRELLQDAISYGKFEDNEFSKYFKTKLIELQNLIDSSFQNWELMSIGSYNMGGEYWQLDKTDKGFSVFRFVDGYKECYSRNQKSAEEALDKAVAKAGRQDGMYDSLSHIVENNNISEFYDNEYSKYFYTKAIELYNKMYPEHAVKNESIKDKQLSLESYNEDVDYVIETFKNAGFPHSYSPFNNRYIILLEDGKPEKVEGIIFSLDGWMDVYCKQVWYDKERNRSRKTLKRYPIRENSFKAAIQKLESLVKGTIDNKTFEKLLPIFKSLIENKNESIKEESQLDKEAELAQKLIDTCEQMGFEVVQDRFDWIDLGNGIHIQVWTGSVTVEDYNTGDEEELPLETEEDLQNILNQINELSDKNESIKEMNVDEDVDTLEKKMDDADTTLKDLMDKINGMSEEVEDTEFDIDKANNLIDEALKED